ncbi:hypothetical protein GTO91_15980 [Heliobacterium undosum]|uniref:Nucleotidyltransferase-like domain-containing protein n=1 Tax=Heliomicrobium undosum TaxID=121734 RepID=A0A845L3J9_9FIRM|nr:GSU2403 family nucleotidyltransferase fold protein [Heliomicrobium undosum]MZP31207.1 hypothetical protein [Heliomicrobium undosum]
MSYGQADVFLNLLKIFQTQGLLRDVMVVGSWAEYIYERAYLPGFRANLKTRDIDFLLPNIKRPNKYIDLPSTLEKENYLFRQDVLNGLTIFFHPESRLEVEFLVREMGRGQIAPYDVQNLNIKAQGLRHMDILCDNPIIVDLNNIKVIVPLPEAYVVHKMVISEKRGNKKEKDLRSITNLLLSLDAQKSAPVFKRIYEQLSKKEKTMLNLTSNRAGIILFPEQFLDLKKLRNEMER